MFSKILLKLVDQAIVPALVLFASRVISLFVFASVFDAEFTVGKYGIVFVNPADYVQVNSYSLFAMVSVLVIALLHNLLKAYYFHTTHITPSLTAKLFTMKLSSLIHSSMDVYSEGIIWLSYAFLMTGVTGLMVMYNLAYSWVFLATLVLSLISTVLFVIDVEKELISHNKIKEEKAPMVLNFQD
jgi:hypothetical protein